MDENKEIYSVVTKFINNNYRFGYSFKFNNSYEDIIRYWSNWFICQENKENYGLNLPNSITSKLDLNVTDELEVIFKTHYNSCDNHMILFYKPTSNEILIKLKVNNTNSKYSIPYWTLKISNKEILEAIKENNIENDNLCVLVYN